LCGRCRAFSVLNSGFACYVWFCSGYLFLVCFGFCFCVYIFVGLVFLICFDFDLMFCVCVGCFDALVDLGVYFLGCLFVFWMLLYDV